MQVRDATSSDSEAIREAHCASIKELAPQSYSQRQVDAWAQGCESANYTEAIESDELEYIVAEREDEIVGFGSLKLAAPEDYEATIQAEVTGAYVHPKVSRQGVGTQIYTELERRAQEAGVEVLGLTPSLNAVPFYEAKGFQRITEQTHEFSSHESTGVTGTVVEMKKNSLNSRHPTEVFCCIQPLYSAGCFWQITEQERVEAVGQRREA